MNKETSELTDELHDALTNAYNEGVQHGRSGVICSLALFGMIFLGAIAVALFTCWVILMCGGTIPF